MQDETREEARTRCGIVYAPGEEASFRVGDHVRVLSRSPIGHYRVPTYLRGKAGIVGALIEPAAIDNEEERPLCRHPQRSAVQPDDQAVL